jgi:cell division protein FtsA
MIKHISVGIDIGSRTTRVVVAEHKEGTSEPVALALVQVETRGVRHGYIIHPEETKKTVAKALKEARIASGVDIKKVLVSMGGVSLDSVTCAGNTIISKADGEITLLDVDKAVKDALSTLSLINRRVIFQNNIQYKIDGKEVLGSPLGMNGTKLEVKVLFVFCLEQHIDLLEDVFVENEIEIVDIIPSPIASSYTTLTDRQKSVGVGLVNVGAETVSLVVYENNQVIGLHVFALGSSDITNDIALGLQVELDDAERIKTGAHEFGSKRKLEEIIEARLSDIFELVGNYLKKIKRYELLPAGIVLTGGGSSLAMMEEFSKALLHLPTKKATIELQTEMKGRVRDPIWNVPYGLVTMAPQYEEFSPVGSTEELLKKLKKSIIAFFKQFLP